MRRLWCLALGASLLTAACRIERTPQEYIDQRDPRVTAREQATDELTARLLSAIQALNAGDVGSVMNALNPVPDAYFVAPHSVEPITGEAPMESALERLIADAAPVRLENMGVRVNPRATTAWFHVQLRGAGGGDAATALTITGVMLKLDEGRWQLVQAHASAPEPLIEP